MNSDLCATNSCRPATCLNQTAPYGAAAHTSDGIRLCSAGLSAPLVLTSPLITHTRGSIKGKISLRGPWSLIAQVISLVISLASAAIMKILILTVPAELRGLTELSNPVLKHS